MNPTCGACGGSKRLTCNSCGYGGTWLTPTGVGILRCDHCGHEQPAVCDCPDGGNWHEPPPRCAVCGGLNPGDITHTRC